MTDLPLQDVHFADASTGCRDALAADSAGRLKKNLGRAGNKVEPAVSKYSDA